MDPNARRVHPQQALAVYVEPLVVGRRVVVLGDASQGLGSRIAELGAHSVLVWDPDPERARREAERAPRGVVVRALPEEDLDARTGAFDLAVITDLELFDDPAYLLARVRRLVGDEGAALVATPNRDRADDSDYYQLFDLVACEFEDVRMIAQLPFHGVALAELGDEGGESPAVSVDTQLAGADPTPEAFVALASKRGVRLDPYAIVELPGRPSARDTEELQARLAAAEQGANELRRLEGALLDRSSRVAELEGVLATRSRELAEHALRIERAEQSLATLEPELARTTDANAAELARYEEALRDRAHAIRLLEAELARREQMVRELVDSLEEKTQAEEKARAEEKVQAGPAEPAPDVSAEREALVAENAQLRDKLDALALDLARREAQAHASAWSIAELERRLQETGPAPAAPDPAVQRGLAAALDELDVLRRALAQEHEARTRAESRHEARPRSDAEGAAGAEAPMDRPGTHR
jgi:SAM-dependent methyltransferase